MIAALQLGDCDEQQTVIDLGQIAVGPSEAEYTAPVDSRLVYITQLIETLTNLQAFAEEIITALMPLGRDRITTDERADIRTRIRQLDRTIESFLRGREAVPEAVKKTVWERDGGRCVLCSKAARLHFDHDIPIAEGGGNTVENIRLLCESCNLKKGSKIE